MSLGGRTVLPTTWDMGHYVLCPQACECGEAAGAAKHIYLYMRRYKARSFPRRRTIVRNAGAFKIGTSRTRFLPRGRRTAKVLPLRHPFGRAIYKRFRR